MRPAILLSFLFLIASGCEDLSDKPLRSEKSALIVVNGNITSENKNHLVTLSLPYQAQNGVALPVSGAFVVVNVDDIAYPLTEYPAGSGFYYTPPLRAITGKKYTLTFSYLGKGYSAEDAPPPVEALPTIAYQGKDLLYTLTPAPFGSGANFIKHNIDWSNTTFCESGSQCAGEIYYYDLKSSDVNEIFKPGKAEFYFPMGATVVRTKYSVSDAYRSFLRSMLSETEWRGGVFDVQRAPVETNLSAGAIGFFSASTVVSDTIVVR